MRACMMKKKTGVPGSKPYLQLHPLAAHLNDLRAELHADGVCGAALKRVVQKRVQQAAFAWQEPTRIIGLRESAAWHERAVSNTAGGGESKWI